jgi:hypothetical protein
MTTEQPKVQKCGTVTCLDPATNRVYWPFQTTDMCQRCTDRANVIAGAMGFALTVAPLVGTPPGRTP